MILLLIGKKYISTECNKEDQKVQLIHKHSYKGPKQFMKELIQITAWQEKSIIDQGWG